MHICLPYGFLKNELFRCLFADLELEYIPAPVAGKHTAAAGKQGAAALCEELQRTFGSLCECYSLGADTALLLPPCSTCDAAWSAWQLEQCLAAAGFTMQLIAVEPAGKNRALFSFLRAQSEVSAFHFWDARRRFYDCRALLLAYEQLLSGISKDSRYADYLLRVKGHIESANSLLQLKIVLRTYLKRLQPLAAAPATEMPAFSAPAKGRKALFFGSL